MTHVEWTLKRPAEANAEEENLRDVKVVDAYNRFARYATVIIDNPSGDKLAKYVENTPIDLYVKRRNDISPVDRFNGFVVDPHAQGRRVVLQVHSHDQWLRRRDVFKTYTAQPILTILEDLITTYTPLTWDATMVEVQNNVNVTRTWRGENLSEVIAELASISAKEEFGAEKKTSAASQFRLGTPGPGPGHPDVGGGALGDEPTLGNVVFFFRPAGVRVSPRQFTQGKYLDAKFNQDRRREVNRVTVFYGDGGSKASLTVQDREAQKALQDKLGMPRPVVIEAVRTYPEITTATAAERKARQILAERLSLMTGEVEAIDCFDVKPGDVARVVSTRAGVDADFRVAEIEYDWRGVVTKIKLAENREGVLDALVSMSAEIGRVDSRDADPNATNLEVLDVTVEMVDDLEVTIIKRTIDTTFFLLGNAWGRGLGDSTMAGTPGGPLGDPRGADVIVESG